MARASPTSSWKAPHIYGIKTVKENAGHYNKRQIKAAYDARDLKERLGNPSDVTMMKMKMIARGIDGCPVSAQDVARATKIFGRSRLLERSKEKPSIGPSKR